MPGRVPYTKARPFTRLLGGVKKRFEDMLPGCRCHAAASIAHVQQDIQTGFDFWIVANKGCIQINIAGLDHQTPAVPHGIAGVDDQIHDHLIDLGGIHVDWLQSRRQPNLELNVLADQPWKSERRSRVIFRRASTSWLRTSCGRWPQSPILPFLTARIPPMPGIDPTRSSTGVRSCSL